MLRLLSSIHIFRVKRLKEEYRTAKMARKNSVQVIHSALISTISDKPVALSGMSRLSNPIGNPLYSPMIIICDLVESFQMMPRLLLAIRNALRDYTKDGLCRTLH